MLFKRVRAGVLLYALLMASVFTLLLQFYFHRVVANERQHHAQVNQGTARLMAELTKNLAQGDSGSITFSQGTSQYSRKENHLKVSVELASVSYEYDFFVDNKEERNDEGDKTATIDIMDSVEAHASLASFGNKE